MSLHLVGGFLGSGKTTAIIQAARLLIKQGRKVGVITNDQGKYLVDTAFYLASDIPALEVTGGCFCCNYADLHTRIGQLIAAARPDAIFAESVGSCADLVATVVRPLFELSQEAWQPASFSVYADVRLLRRRLLGQEMPFSDDVVYIFDEQLEEAGLLVINKIDLVLNQQLEEVEDLLKTRFPRKTLLFQSALTAEGVRPWLEQIQSAGFEPDEPPLAIDYARYGVGETQLAWCDEEVVFHFLAGQGRALVRRMLLRIVEKIKERGAGIGHLKFLIRDGVNAAKISLPSMFDLADLDPIPEILGEEVNLLFNARVEMPAEALRAALREAIEASGLAYEIKLEEAFHPSPPRSMR